MGAGQSGRAVIFLGHGASGNADSMKPYVAGLARRGVDAQSVPAMGKLPTRAEKAMQVFRELAADHPGCIVGGHSYGGRVASMVAAEDHCWGACPLQLSATSAGASRGAPRRPLALDQVSRAAAFG